MSSSELISRLKSLCVRDPLSPADQSDEASARRLLLALQMSDDGIRIMRAKIRRDKPNLSEAEVEECLRAWLHDVPEPGLAEGFRVRKAHRFTR